MNRRAIIGRVLASLAIAGLIVVPIARPVVAMPVEMHAVTSEQPEAGAISTVATDDMPCCPSKRSVPDCGKDCPFMALCTAAVLLGAPQVALSAPIAFVSIVFSGDQTDLASIARAPPQRPPKA